MTNDNFDEIIQKLDHIIALLEGKNKPAGNGSCSASASQGEHDTPKQKIKKPEPEGIAAELFDILNAERARVGYRRARTYNSYAQKEEFEKACNEFPKEDLLAIWRRAIMKTLSKDYAIAAVIAAASKNKKKATNSVVVIDI